MDVRIGIAQSGREIEVELADGVDGDQVAALVEKALKADGGVVWLTDRKGRRVGVPAARLAYVEIATGHEDRRVGFGAP